MERCLKRFKNQIISTEDFETYYYLVKPNYWMLVCDKSFTFLPKTVVSIYKNHIDNCVVFDDFEPNPNYESVVKGIELLSKYDCSLIVAIGGGSTIDVAKCIKLYSGLNRGINYLKQNPNYSFISNINLVALPTTAGTGSESTKHAVIYYNGVKQSICDVEIIPDLVILDPLVLDKLPPLHKKASMLDALCQACESWWSNGATTESIHYSEICISGIIDQWELYMKGDSYAAEIILKAANYAGRAINITKTTAAHAMSYKLSSLYHLPHGIAVALCFPVVWRHMLDKVDGNLKMTFDRIALNFHKLDVESAINYFEQILLDLGINKPLSDNKERDIAILVDSVNPERLSNNPIQFTKEELKKMYEEIIQ